MRPPTKPAEHWKQKRTSQPGTLIKRPARPAVWQLIKPDQSPAALGKAPQDPPLTTVQVALAPDMGGVVELLGGGLHPTTPAGKEAHPAMPMPERALLAAVRQPPRTPLAVPRGRTARRCRSGCTHTARRTAGCRRRAARGARVGQGGPSREGGCATW